MTSITEHFSLEEFDGKEGTPYPKEWIDTRLKPLCESLEKIRALTGQPLHVIDGYRTLEHNAKILGSAKKSQHIQGTAVDFTLQGMDDNGQLYNAVDHLIEQGEIPEGGLGLYKDHVHYDQRGQKARWIG